VKKVLLKPRPQIQYGRRIMEYYLENHI